MAVSFCLHLVPVTFHPMSDTCYIFASGRFLFCLVSVTFVCFPCFGFVLHRIYALAGGYVFYLMLVTFSRHNLCIIGHFVLYPKSSSLYLRISYPGIVYVLSSCRLRLAFGIPARSDCSLYNSCVPVTVLPHVDYTPISCRLHVCLMWVTSRLWHSCPLRRVFFSLVSVTFLPHIGCTFTSCGLHFYLMGVTFRLRLSCPLRRFAFYLIPVTFLPNVGYIFTSCRLHIYLMWTSFRLWHLAFLPAHAIFLFHLSMG